jgi:hypothetical protein
LPPELKNITPLKLLVEQELTTPVDPRVTAMATAIAAKHRAASRAVLFYGSCLREKQLDGLMLDFYLIVSDYRAAYERRWLSVANRWIPPNVFHFEHDGLRAKYAVLSEADFHRLNGPETRSVSVWARFAQPSRLAWVADESAQRMAIDAIARAAPTLLQYTMPMLAPDRDHSISDIWNRGFGLTYGAELRAERAGKGASIAGAEPERFERFGQASLSTLASLTGVGPNGEVANVMSPKAMARWWRRTQWKGKALSVIRLAKATATFAGGVDYIAWKINRHAGTEIVIKPWQRRWPLLAAISLLPRLLKSGAVR